MAQIETISSNPPTVLGSVGSLVSVELRQVYGASPSALGSLTSAEPTELDSLAGNSPSQIAPIESKRPVAWYPGGGTGGGNSWWYGDGPPSNEIPGVSGDLYYDTLTGNVYAFE